MQNVSQIQFGKINEGDESTLEQREGQEEEDIESGTVSIHASSWTFCYRDFLIPEAYADGTRRVILDRTQLKAESTTGHWPLRMCKKGFYTMFATDTESNRCLHWPGLQYPVGANMLIWTGSRG